MIKLKELEPIARGRMRLVYEYPGDPSFLIKVIRPEVINERWGEGQPWYKMQRRYGHYISYMREIGEYVATYAKYGRSLDFIQRTRGLTETDLGLGLVLDAYRDRNGDLAPSLSNLLDRGQYDAKVEEALQVFIEQILSCDVVIADLHGGNIVYTYSEEKGDHFVMIDGLGLSNIIPFKTMFRSSNHKSKLRHVERLRTRMANKLAEISAMKKS